MLQAKDTRMEMTGQVTELLDLFGEHKRVKNLCFELLDMVAYGDFTTEQLKKAVSMNLTEGYRMIAELFFTYDKRFNIASYYWETVEPLVDGFHDPEAIGLVERAYKVKMTPELLEVICDDLFEEVM